MGFLPWLVVCRWSFALSLCLMMTGGYGAAEADMPSPSRQGSASLRMSPPFRPAVEFSPMPEPDPASFVPLPKTSGDLPTHITGEHAFRLRRVDGPPVREADAISSAWLAQATPLENFTQSHPKEGALPTEKTVVHIGYDAKNLYVIFYCYDSQVSQISAHYSKRDDVYSDDHVAVILDTFNDGRRAYKFVTNPFGVQTDGLFTEEGGEDATFDTVFQTHAHVTRFGYLAIMEIPFRSLRFANHFPQTWGINLLRYIKRKDEVLYWSPVYRDRRGFLSQAGKLTALESVPRSRGYELIPYVFASSTTTVDGTSASASPVKQSTAKTGLDLKYSLTPNITANLTINPDFNDLEADQPRLRVNRRFKDSAEVFIPEKRPFFLERSDFFRTPLNVFFTRKIVDPKFGAKITGKVGPYNLGFLSARDAAPTGDWVDTAAWPRDDERHAAVNALRVSRDLYGQSTLGLIAVDREMGDAFDRLVGVDANFRFLEKYELTMQYVHSFTRSLEEEDARGAGYLLAASRSARHLSMGGHYLNLAPGFRAELGFNERSDVNQFGGFINYDFRPEGRVLVNWGPRVSYSRNYDHAGTLNDVRLDLGLGFELVGNTALGVKFTHNMERFADVPYKKHPVSFYVNTNRAQKISGGFSYSFGSEIHYREHDAFLGRGRVLSLDTTLRPNPHFKVEGVYLMSHLNKDFDGRPRGFTAHTLQTRWSYQFNRELFVRLIPEYEFISTRDLLAEDSGPRRGEARRLLRGNFLLGYVLRPGTVLYAGYNSSFEEDAFRPGRRLRLGDRGLFVKFSYLYR